MAKGRAQDTFIAKAPGIMRQLMADFPIGINDAAAIVGNLGHECEGFTTLQEIEPAVKGSRGGYGWAQWTGSRRRDYESYCKRNGLDPASDKANYAFLFLELAGSEKKAIVAVTKARTLEAKVVAFEKAFLRAGVKNYPSRQQWAQIALRAFEEQAEKPAGKPAGAQKPLPTTSDTAKPANASPRPSTAGNGKSLIAGILAALGLSVSAGGAQADPDRAAAWILAGIIVLAGIGAAVLIARRKRK